MPLTEKEIEASPSYRLGIALSKLELLIQAQKELDDLPRSRSFKDMRDRAQARRDRLLQSATEFLAAEDAARESVIAGVGA